MIKLISPLNQVDSSAAFTAGTKTQTKDGNEYIYLPGTTSVAAYDVVTFTTASGLSYGSVVRLATTGGVGMVAVAQAAIIGPKYGWFMIRGVGWANAGAVATSGSALYASGTAGLCSTAVVAGDLLAGAFCVGTGVSGGTCKVLLNNPFCTDTMS